MERYSEILLTDVASRPVAMDEAPEFAGDDFAGREEFEESPKESVYTDDPVRVYLREMGSVSLLTRQRETDLARRMERGTLRARKALSRSAVVQRMVMALYNEIQQGETRLEDVVAIGRPDEAAKKRARTKARRAFEKAAALHDD